MWLAVALFIFLNTYFDWRRGYAASQPRFPKPFHWYGSLTLRVLGGLYITTLGFPLKAQAKNELGTLWFLATALCALVILLLEFRRLLRQKRR